MEESTHFLHNHPLILNEVVRISFDKDVECVGCMQPINKSIDSFYSCSSLRNSASTSSPSPDCLSFFMHKTCFELPQQYKHPKFTFSLSLGVIQIKYLPFWICDVCRSESLGLGYSTITNNPIVCLKCVTSELRSLEDRNLRHPGHSHPLTLVQRPSLFLCDACNTTATDLSYVCTKCSFCIHKNCVNALDTYNCKFHKHPLKLAYSLPVEYHNFFRLCGICNKNMNPIYWVYYCANCRFFAHVKCASSTEMQSKNDNDEAGSEDSNLVHFPATDESSLNDMMQQFIRAKINDSDIAAPREYINHWAHGGHQIGLKKRNATIPHDLADDGLLICNCCIKPISSGQGDHLFYECNSCNNFVMHTSCAQFPREMHHNVLGTMVAQQSEPYNYFLCRGCFLHHNGILFSTTIKDDDGETVCFDIGCASLPTTVKHEAHRHPLNQFICEPAVFLCAACQLRNYDRAMFGCKDCKVYMHMGCVLKPRALKHRWDPHPLYLILSAGDVVDHPHAFECELCSIEIDTNGWFYHCSECDQSFHIDCTDPHSVCTYDDDNAKTLRSYTNVKFGATNIDSEEHPHPHGLIFLLSKRKHICNKCGQDTFYRPVLECSPCKFIVHADCDDD